MKRFLGSPYAGLVMTGIAASIALLIESQLQVSSDAHFLLQFVWVGVVAAALLVFALMPALKTPYASVPPIDEVEADPHMTVTAEFLDEDRLWLQAHPDSSRNEQI